MISRYRQKAPIGFINVTALVPTVGHQYLVQFAAEFMAAIGGDLHVVISSRSFEPVSGQSRYVAFTDQFINMSNVDIHLHEDDDAPQQDDGTEEFWKYWTGLAWAHTNMEPITHLFASEPYGAKYAAKLDATFIPCDIGREVFPVKGTPVRNALNEKFNHVMPAFRKFVAKRITLFGADSTGKTTMARRLAADPAIGGTFLHEWARPYLECVGADVTPQRMDNITLGQFAAMKASIDNGATTPFTYQDTDLLTTRGFFKLFGMNPTHNIDHMIDKTKSDLYVVMNTNIPFEKDPLRYGGDVRESTTEFWIEMLEQFGFPYYVVKATDPDEQFAEITEQLAEFQRKAWYDIAEFQRD